MDDIIMVPAGDYMLCRDIKTNEFLAWRTQITIAPGVKGFGDFERIPIKTHTWFEAYTEMKNKEAREWLESQGIAN